MAKAVFGEYGAFTSKNSIRYTKNNKMTSEGNVPPEVVIYLNNKLKEETPATQTTELPKQRLLDIFGCWLFDIEVISRESCCIFG